MTDHVPQDPTGTVEHDGPVVQREFFCPELAAAKISDAAKMQIVKYAHVYACPGTYYGINHSELQNRHVTHSILGNREEHLRETLAAGGDSLSAAKLEGLVKAQITFLVDHPKESEEIAKLVRG